MTALNPAPRLPSKPFDWPKLIWWTLTIALVAATFAFIIGIRMIAQRAPRPDRLGVVSNRLLPCPDTPNCVNSFDGATPLSYSGDRETAYKTMQNLLREWPRTEVVRSDENYIRRVPL